MVILVSFVSVVAVHTLLHGWQTGRGALRTAHTGAAHRRDQRVGRPGRPDPGQEHVVVAAPARRARCRRWSWSTGRTPQFFRQHRTLADLYDLTRAVVESGQDGTLADALLGRVRALMQAEYATLWLPAQGRHPGGPAHRPGRRPGPARPRADPGDDPRAGARARGARWPSAAGWPTDGELRRRPAPSGGQGRGRGTAAVRSGGDRHARGGQPARRRQPLHARATSRSSRRSPRTPRWPWRIPGWSTGCATTRTTTR